MKAITLAAQAIMLGHRDIMVAGGMESMSNVPYYVEKARGGFGLGHGTITDGIIKDGLWDVYYNQHMGNCAEDTAAKLQITREDQDQFAVGSYQKAAKAVQVLNFYDLSLSCNFFQKRQRFFLLVSLLVFGSSLDFLRMKSFLLLSLDLRDLPP